MIPPSSNSSSSSLPTLKSATNGAKLNPNFKYIQVPPNLFVRTVDMNVNILADPQSSGATDGNSAPTTTEQNGTSNNGEEILESEFEPFDMPLPIPPNSKLYRDLQNSSPMKQPVVYYRMREEGHHQSSMKKRSSNASNTSQGNLRRESVESSFHNNNNNTTTNEHTEVIDEDAASDDGSEISDTIEEELAENVWIPYEVEGRPTLGNREEMPFNSVNLRYHSKGYVYEDTWNVEETRPIIAKTILKEDYRKYKIDANNSLTHTDSSTKMDGKKEEPKKQQDDGNTTSSSTEKEEELFDPYDVGIDRSDWTSRALENNPCIRELKERLYPLWRAISFAQLYDAGLKEVKNTLTDDLILNMILQHVTFEGLKNTKDALEKESNRKYKWIDTDQSIIHGHVKEAIKKVERFYDTIICDKVPLKERQKQRTLLFKEIDEQLGEFGIVDETSGATNKSDMVDIWDEPPKKNVIMEVDPVTQVEHLHAASFNVLIERLTSSNDPGLFGEAFFTTYQSFTSPEVLLNKLIERYNVPRRNMSELEYEIKKGSIQKNVCNILHYWVQKHFYHLDNKLQTKLVQFLEDVAKDSAVEQIATEIIKVISSQQQQQQTFAKKSAVTRLIEPKVNLSKLFNPMLNILDIDEEEFARQLTLVEFDMFSQIKEQELLNQAWNKPKLKHIAPNVLKLLEFADHLSNWVASHILQFEKKNDRKLALRKFIKTCEYLKQFNNFNSLKSVLRGLSNMAISRLHQNKDELEKPIKALLNDLVALMSDYNRTYKAYKDTLKTVPANSPTIPFLEVILTDLQNYEEGAPDYIKHNDSNLINWNKRESLFDTISEIRKYQSIPYLFVPVFQIQEFIKKMNGRIDDQQALLTFSRKVE